MSASEAANCCSSSVQRRGAPVCSRRTVPATRPPALKGASSSERMPSGSSWVPACVSSAASVRDSSMASKWPGWSVRLKRAPVEWRPGSRSKRSTHSMAERSSAIRHTVTRSARAAAAAASVSAAATPARSPSCSSFRSASAASASLCRRRRRSRSRCSASSRLRSRRSTATQTRLAERCAASCMTETESSTGISSPLRRRSRRSALCGALVGAACARSPRPPTRISSAWRPVGSQSVQSSSRCSAGLTLRMRPAREVTNRPSFIEARTPAV